MIKQVRAFSENGIRIQLRNEGSSDYLERQINHVPPDFMKHVKSSVHNLQSLANSGAVYAAIDSIYATKYAENKYFLITVTNAAGLSATLITPWVAGIHDMYGMCEHIPMPQVYVDAKPAAPAVVSLKPPDYKPVFSKPGTMDVGSIIQKIVASQSK